MLLAESILEEVLKRHPDVTPEMLATSRKHIVLRAREDLCGCLHHLTSLSTVEMAKMMGTASHNTARGAIQRFEEKPFEYKMGFLVGVKQEVKKERKRRETALEAAKWGEGPFVEALADTLRSLHESTKLLETLLREYGRSLS